MNKINIHFALSSLTIQNSKISLIHKSIFFPWNAWKQNLHMGQILLIIKHKSPYRNLGSGNPVQENTDTLATAINKVSSPRVPCLLPSIHKTEANLTS